MDGLITKECPGCKREHTVFRIALEKGIGILCPQCFYEQNKALDIHMNENIKEDEAT